MYLLHNKKLPAVLPSQFSKIEEIHSHNTRQILKCVFHNQQNQLLKTSWLFGAQNYGVASTAQLRIIAGVSLNKNIKFI